MFDAAVIAIVVVVLIAIIGVVAVIGGWYDMHSPDSVVVIDGLCVGWYKQRYNPCRCCCNLLGNLLVVQVVLLYGATDFQP
jgi:hypothetical protein